MKIVHLLVGEEAAAKFTEVVVEKEGQEELFVLKDQLNFGPLKTEGMTFSEGRTAFWNSLDSKPTIPAIDDMERLMDLSTRLSNTADLSICFWTGGDAAEVCAFYWLIHYLKKHLGRFSVIDISGLPFIDEEGKLFYTSNVADLPLRELKKAQKLVRPLPPSEWEAELGTWGAFVTENAQVRFLAGGGKMQGSGIDHFDADLLEALAAEKNRAQRAIQKVMRDSAMNRAKVFLESRIRHLQRESS